MAQGVERVNSKDMKILFICPEDLKGERRGGVSTSTLILAKHLAKLGNEVYVLSRGDENSFFRQSNYQVYIISDFEFKKNIFLKILCKVLDRGLKKFFPEFVGRIYWALYVFFFVKEKGPFDIIESPEWCNNALFISLFTKSKVVVKLHRGWYCYLKDNDLPISIDEWLICLLEFLSIIFATALTSPSEFMFNYYKPLITIFKKIRKNENIKVIPYGVEIETTRKFKLKYTSKNRYLLSVGRIEKAKGSFTLIKSFEQVIKRYKNIKLILIGEDTQMFVKKKLVNYKEYLKSYIYKNHLEEGILLLPKKTSTQLREYYKNCLFFIAPSVGTENFPMVLLEAVSYNKAVIGSNTGGIPEIIRHKANGLLFSPNNTRDLVRIIELLLGNDKLRLEFEQYNARYKKRFDIRKIALQTASFYNKVSKN